MTKLIYKKENSFCDMATLFPQKVTTLKAHAMSDIIIKLQITDKLLIWLKYPFTYRNYAPGPQLIFTTTTTQNKLYFFRIKVVFISQIGNSNIVL